MIVDDDRDVLMVLQKIAARVSDAEIECFRNSQDALAAFEATPGGFDFVMTDFDMPGMDGLELCGLLRAMAPGLKVLLVTASNAIAGEEIVKSGFCGIVRKPFQIPTLVSALVAAGVGHAPNDTREVPQPRMQA